MTLESNLSSAFQAVGADMKGKAPASVTPIPVSSFGVKGNGSVDDSAAIAMALNGCPPGRTLYFHPGTYVINTPIVVNRRITRGTSTLRSRCGRGLGQRSAG